jgi:hypothetical protein
VNHPRVLVDLAEQILAVDQLERPSPQLLERQAGARKLGVRELGDRPDDIGVVESSRVREALRDAIACAGTRCHEVHLRKIDDLAVVEVDGELKREEAAQRRVAAEDL